MTVDSFRKLREDIQRHLYSGDRNKMLETIRESVTRMHKDPDFYLECGNLSSQLGDHLLSVECYERALVEFPDNLNVLMALGRVQMELGRLDVATYVFEKVISLSPAFGAAYERLAASRKTSKKDRHFVTQAERQLEKGVPAYDRRCFCFALGKMHDDMGEYDRAFQYFENGNRLLNPPDKRAFESKEFRLLRKICTRQRLLKKKSWKNMSEVPVFIVGMPRSGTTLVEQIISSHPQVAGAGELMELSHVAFRVAQKISGMPSLSWTLRISHTDFLCEMAEVYLTTLRSGRMDAFRITDKMPENYKLLGLISLLFPNAKILHVSRHPLDTCLSCYFQMFDSLTWTTDLLWIASAYRHYRQLMDHWKKVLPPNMIIDVSYEDLVANPGLCAPQLIKHIGLEWDPICLEYLANQRIVNTASNWQVRQPIYQTSKMRWVHYAKHLTGLASELAEFLTEDDFRVFAEQGLNVKSSSFGRKIF